MTFNHAACIQDALNGFSMQKTDFPYVAVIVDDASTDGNQDVILDYYNKHLNTEEKGVPWSKEDNYARYYFARHKENPNCFFAILLLKENQFRNPIKGELMKEWQNASKYIALCEGDDYWTDPLKLEKQVCFLENHPDYSMCFHRAAVLDYLGNGSWLRCFDIEDKDYTSDELFSEWKVPTNSMVFKRESLTYPITNREWILNGDIILVLSCSHTGKVRGMSEYMSVYRIQPGGVTYDPSKQRYRTLRYPEHFECIRENFPRLSEAIINRALALHYYERSLIQAEEKDRRSDYEMAKKYNPGLLRQKKREKWKHAIKRVVLFPFHSLSALLG